MNNLDQLPDNARIWIYQSSRPFTESEAQEIQSALNEFTHSWVSHNRQLTAAGQLLHQLFVVLSVDESRAGASGCSIDSSVKFIQSLEGRYGVSFFDRMTFTYWDGDSVRMAARPKFAQLYADGAISDETQVFDNLVKTKGDFDRAWHKSLSESWHKRFV